MAEATATRSTNSRVFEPDALNAARAAAAAAGVSLEEWLTRTIMTTASRVNAAPHGHYAPSHDDGPAMSDNMARHLRMAHDAAQSAGVTVTDWLNQAILESVQRERGRPVARAPVFAAPPAPEPAQPHTQPQQPDQSPTAVHRQTPLPSALTGTASQPAWRADTRRAPPHPEPTPEHDAAVQDELDARLARIITATRAELAREESGDEPTVTVAENAPPSAPTGRRKGSPMLTGAMIVLLIAAAAAIWLIPNIEKFGLLTRQGDPAQQTTQAPSPAMPPARTDAPPPKVTDVTPANPRASDPKAADPKATEPKPGDTKGKPDPAANRYDTDELPRPVQQYVDWYQRAAKEGNVRAQIVLAHMYLRGEGVAKDQKMASEWFRRAGTDGNNAEAQYSLGVLYERGVGVEKDRLEALLWYERAARQNHVGALYNVGVAYAEGVFDRGVRKEKDYARAREYFLRAAELGDSESQYNLGVIYQEGLGTEKDPVEALKWYSIATARNYKRAGDAAQRLIPTMTQEQRDRASELVLEYNQRQKK